MGSPRNPTPEQSAKIEAGGHRLLESPRWVASQGGRIDVTFMLPRQGVSLVRDRAVRFIKEQKMRACNLAVALAALVGALPAIQAQSAQPPYLDPSQPVETRIADLVSRMTLEEKAAELNHLSSRNDRLHIPAWGGWNQTLHGVWSKQPTTPFPTAIGMSATWDPALVKTITDAMADEARALYNIGADGPRTKAGLMFRSPVINISRDPRWGRIQECFGRV